MSQFELIKQDAIPAATGGHVMPFRDALEAALANPNEAVRVPGLTQRQRNRLRQLTSAAPSNTSKYAGLIKTTPVRNEDGSYDVYLSAIPGAPPPTLFDAG